MNPMSLDGRVIVVTGAGQGIGKAVAELAHGLGARLALVERNAETVAAVAKNLPGAKAYVGSVTDGAFVEATAAAVEQEFGRIDGLVNNAGIIRPALIEKMSMEQWDAVIGVNLTGVFLCLQAFGKRMVARAKQDESQGNAAAPGHIVNVSSDAGRRGTMGQINYGAAKSGVLGITMSAAREWARSGVTVNSVCFGMVETEMTETVRGPKFRDTYLQQIPMRRFSAPEEVAKPVCFLLSDAASYVTGQHLSINGGFHIGM